VGAVGWHDKDMRKRFVAVEEQKELTVKVVLGCGNSRGKGRAGIEGNFSWQQQTSRVGTG